MQVAQVLIGNVLAVAVIAALLTLSATVALTCIALAKTRLVTAMGFVVIGLLSLVAVPEMSEDRSQLIMEQITPILRKTGHQMRLVDADPGLEELKKKGVRVTTMGRSIEQDREFFLAASAGGVLAAEILSTTD